MVAWVFKCYGGCKLALLIGSHGCYRDGWWLKASKFPRKSICSRGGGPRNRFAREEPQQWASSLHTSPSQMEQAIARSHPLGARTYTCFHACHSRTHAMPIEFLLIKDDKRMIICRKVWTAPIETYNMGVWFDCCTACVENCIEWEK